MQTYQLTDSEKAQYEDHKDYIKIRFEFTATPVQDGWDCLVKDRGDGTRIVTVGATRGDAFRLALSKILPGIDALTYYRRTAHLWKVNEHAAYQMYLKDPDGLGKSFNEWDAHMRAYN